MRYRRLCVLWFGIANFELPAVAAFHRRMRFLPQRSVGERRFKRRTEGHRGLRLLQGKELEEQLVLDADRPGLEVPILAEEHLVRRESAGGGAEHFVARVRQRARLPLVPLREARVRVVVRGQRVEGWD